MADDIIITEFGADLSKFNNEVDKAAKSIDNLDAEIQGAAKSGRDLSGNMGDAGKKVAMLGVEAQRTAKSIDKVSESTAGVGGSVNKGSTGVLGFLSKIKTGFSDFGKGAKEGISDVFKEFGGGGNILNSLGDKVKGIGSSILGTFKGVGSGIADAFKGASDKAGGDISGFGLKALAALGPIGIAAAAVGAALIAVFANTDAGATYFDGLKRSGGIAFDKITGAVTTFFDTLNDGQSTIGQVFGYLKDAIDIVTAPLRGLISGIGELTGITEFFREANREGQELANAYDAIDEAQYKNIVANAELEKQVSSLNIKLRDRTLSQEEALKIADELTAKEKERAAKELEILKMTTAAKQKEADNELKNKKEVSDGTARALADAQAAEIRAAQQSEDLQEQAAVRVNLINEKASNRQEAEIAKQKAANEKAAKDREDAAKKQAQEAIKLAKEIAEATAKAQDVKAAPKEEARRAVLSPEQTKVDDLSIIYKKQLDDAAKAFDQLRKLKEGDAEAIAQIDQEMADNAVAIEANKNASLAELRGETLQQIRDVSATEEQLQTEAINKKFDGLESAARAVITNEEELTATLVELTKARQEQLDNVGADKLQSIRDALSTEDQIQIDAVNKKFDDLEAAAQDVITNEEELTAALIALETERQDQLTEISAQAAQERLDETIKGTQDVLNALSGLGDTILASEKANTDERLAEYDREIEAKKKLGEDTTALEAKRTEEQKANERKAYQTHKAFALAQIAVDTAQAISSAVKAAAANPFNAVTFSAAGIAQLAASLIAIAANIAQAKALLGSKAPGLYKGDPRIGGKPDYAGRDGYLRRLDKDERVVPAKDNLEHWDLYEAIRKGKLNEWKEQHMNPIALNFERIANIPSTREMIAYNFAPKINSYVESNSGTVKLTIPKGHDKGMIDASKESTREQKQTNELLAAMLSRRTSAPSKRTW